MANKNAIIAIFIDLTNKEEDDDDYFCTISTKNVINLAQQGYCNHFNCLSVCFLCVRSVPIYTYMYCNTIHETLHGTL